MRKAKLEAPHQIKQEHMPFGWIAPGIQDAAQVGRGYFAMALGYQPGIQNRVDTFGHPSAG